MKAFAHFRSKCGFINDIDHDIKEGLISEIQCPTLIVHSKNDNSVPYAHAEYANKMIKNSKLEGLDNEWGHLLWIGKDSVESIRKITAFIEQ